MTSWSARKYHAILSTLLMLMLVIMVQSFSVQDMSIDEYLEYVNPPAVEKYQNANGNMVLCVKCEDQISPLETEINVDVNGGEVEYRRNRKMGRAAEKAYRCPAGTVGITETKREAVERAGSVAQYLNQFRKFLPRRNTLNISNVNVEPNRLQAVGEYYASDESPSIHGAYGEINIWSPSVTEDAIFSDAHITVAADKDYQEFVEAGWHVYPNRYGDQLPRFFTAWTADNYNSTGCMDNECEGFKLLYDHPDTKKPLPFSHYRSQTQEVMEIKIERVMRDGQPAWDLHVGDILLGYWPGSLFKKLDEAAMVVQYGGSVLTKAKSSTDPVTKTDMGSGRFGDSGYTKAAFIGNIDIFDDKGKPMQPVYNAYATNVECYRVALGFDSAYPNRRVFFGGPGGDHDGCSLSATSRSVH